ncbi:MAG: DNA repair protein RadA [Candidatus Saccharibacteria bacterium]|nr:DNA repair protein RadA [Candidatus Saccharibacteria bacterium]
MAKSTTQYTCQQCGAVYSKWVGKCENCGSWNSLLESTPVSTGKSAVAKSRGTPLKAKKLSQVQLDNVKNRLVTGFGELDVVLGGGLMSGGVLLMAGQPGIGKSTLLLQIAANVANKKSVLYVSGEESAGQIKLRAERLGAHEQEALSLASSTSADDIAATISEGTYDLVIVDSIQTLSLNEITSAPGTVSQITNSSNVIIRAAKSSNTSVVLVGHVTKEGSIAGPKVLEHLVDVVLNFEGDRYGGFKIIRAIKNRYGSTSEAAILEMVEEGLKQVENPSAALLAERQNTDGSVILATLEGNRPLLVEIQALVNPTHFGYPKRTASGFDINRLNLLIAVLEKRTKLKLSESDIYINVVGGLKLADPAADLAVAMAIASAAASRKIGDGVVVFGEVGLGGEIRSAIASDRRLDEAKKLGFTQAITPKLRTSTKFAKQVTDLRSALVDYLK